MAMRGTKLIKEAGGCCTQTAKKRSQLLKFKGTEYPILVTRKFENTKEIQAKLSVSTFVSVRENNKYIGRLYFFFLIH